MTAISLEELHLRRKEGKIITKKATLSQEIKKSLFALIFTLVSISIILSTVFLLNKSQETQKGYVLEKEQQDRENALLKSRELIQKIIEAQAFKTIQNSTIVKDMLAPENITYITENKKGAAPKIK